MKNIKRKKMKKNHEGAIIRNLLDLKASRDALSLLTELPLEESNKLEEIHKEFKDFLETIGVFKEKVEQTIDSESISPEVSFQELFKKLGMMRINYFESVK
jgi:hypothetical protein